MRNTTPQDRRKHEKNQQEDKEWIPLLPKASCHDLDLEKTIASSVPLISVRQELWDLSTMAFQLTLRQMVRQAMTITDSAFQGHIGTKQLAGVSLASMWMGVPSAFIQFSIQAINTLCSQAYGAGNYKLVGLWLQTACIFAILGAIPVMMWYMVVGHMISLTMDDEETVAYGRTFAQIMALGLIPQYLYGAISTYFAAQGVIMPATFCSTFTMILNIALNQILIYGLGSWPGFGFIGSPLATVTSTCIQLMLYCLYTLGYRRAHETCWPGWQLQEAIHRDRVMPFLALALPMGASAVVDWASATVAGAFSGSLGPVLAASQSVLSGVFGLANAAVSGYATATQIRMSRYLGEGSARGARRCLGLGTASVLLGALILVGSLTVVHHVLFEIWTTDDAILSSCEATLVVFVLCLVVAFSRFLLTAVMTALGHARLNLFANNVASWCVYVPLSYVLPILWHWGLPGFWWADLAGESLKLTVLLRGLARVDWYDVARETSQSAKVKPKYVQVEEQLTLCAYEQQALVMTTTPTSSPFGTLTPSRMRPSRQNYETIPTHPQRRDSLPWS